MKHNLLKRIPVLALAAALTLTVGTQALFGLAKRTRCPRGRRRSDLEIATYRDIPYEAQFLVSGGEGETLTFAVADQPRKGTVVVEGDRFTYAPDEGVTGSDSFTYTAADAQGRVSAPATVTVEIQKPRSGVTYADTAGTAAAAAAQDLAEAGIFTGVKIGDQYYFEPDKTVTRGEFLAMVLETHGPGGDGRHHDRLL